MKTYIYYFSATGNSLKVAKDMAEEFMHTTIFNISSLMSDPDKKIMTDCDRLGIVYPSYYLGIPLIVERFINRMKRQNPGLDKYIFSVCTYGSYPGASNRYLSRVLKKEGLILRAGFNIKMAENFLPMYDVTAIKKIDELEEKLRQKIIPMCDIVRDMQKHMDGNIFDWIPTLIFYNYFRSKKGKLDKEFYSDESCNSCGLCEKICPVDNIRIVDKKPAWQGHCELCLACLHWCPEHSIQYTKNTVGKKRYHHPKITSADILKDKEIILDGTYDLAKKDSINKANRCRIL